MSSLVLCYITDRSQLKSRTLTALMRETLRAGVDMVQVREKDLSARELMALVEEAVAAARELQAVARASRPRTRGHSSAPRSRKSRHSRESGNPSCSGRTTDPRLRGGDETRDFHFSTGAPWPPGMTSQCLSAFDNLQFTNYNSLITVHNLAFRYDTTFPGSTSCCWPLVMSFTW